MRRSYRESGVSKEDNEKRLESADDTQPVLFFSSCCFPLIPLTLSFFLSFRMIMSICIYDTLLPILISFSWSMLLFPILSLVVCLHLCLSVISFQCHSLLFHALPWHASFSLILHPHALMRLHWNVFNVLCDMSSVFSVLYFSSCWDIQERDLACKPPTDTQGSMGSL